MTIKVGIIGSGQMAKIRADALIKAGASKIEWILSENGESAKQLAEKYQCKHYGRWENRNDVTAGTSVDLVLVEVPHFIQDSCSKWALLEQNTHLLIGGPLALNPDSGYEILNLAHKKNRIIETGFEQVYTFYKDAYHFVRNIGEIIDIQSNAEFPANPQSWYYNESASGGMILTHLTYCFLAPIMQLLNDDFKPESVYAVGGQNMQKGHKFVSNETCTALVTFSQKTDVTKKIVYTARGSYVKSGNIDPWHITIRGTESTIKLFPPLDMPGGKIIISSSSSLVKHVETENVNPFQVQAVAVLQAIKENNFKPLINTAEKGLQILKIVSMIEQSIKENVVVNCGSTVSKSKISTLEQSDKKSDIVSVTKGNFSFLTPPYKRAKSDKNAEFQELRSRL